MCDPTTQAKKTINADVARLESEKEALKLENEKEMLRCACACLHMCVGQDRRDSCG